MKKITAGSSGFCPGRRRGTVMIEFMMVIPLLAVILGYTFFFGWAMVNQQHVKIVDRFQTWRKVRVRSTVGAKTLNEQIFQGHLDEDTYHQDSEKSVRDDDTFQTFNDLVDWVRDAQDKPEDGEDGLDMVKELLGTEEEKEEAGKAERGRRITVHGKFPSEIGIFQSVEDYQGAIKHAHMRDGREWRWRQLRCEEVIKDVFLIDLDDELEDLFNTDSKGLAETAQDLYLKKW